jgi:superfamily II DNA or RNA helicase
MDFFGDNSNSEYERFLASKRRTVQPEGFAAKRLNTSLWQWQADVTAWICRMGRASLFWDCVAGDTIISSPDGDREIGLLTDDGKPIRVYSVDTNGNIVIADASCPFVNGYGALYEIEFESGTKILATRRHRFLTSSGWLSVGSLQPSQRLVAFSPILHSSISDVCLLTRSSGVLHLRSVQQDSQESYFACLRRRDEQLQMAGEISLAFVQQQDDVPVHGQRLLHADVLGHKSSHIHQCRDNDHLSTQDSFCLDASWAEVAECQPLSFGCERYFWNNQRLQLFPEDICLPSQVYGASLSESESFAGVQCETCEPPFICFDTVASVHYIKHDWHYDIWVPGFSNYFANGICSHNCGLGKTIAQLAYVDAAIREGHAKRGLVLCPLAVAQQTADEAAKFQIETDCRVVRESSQIDSGINITNYDRFDKFDPAVFDLLVLDESSILKSRGEAKTREKILRSFSDCRYRLACTATPAPNDLIELGGHAEFMGVMRAAEMLGTFFVHDSSRTQNWRLMPHGAKDFWQWVASWANSISTPADLGYPDDDFRLPPLEMQEIVIEDSDKEIPPGWLFSKGSLSATGVHAEKRSTAERRAGAVAEKVNASGETWLIWCDTNYEADELKRFVENAVEIRGNDPIDRKEEILTAFSAGEIQRLISKPTLSAHGVNWQHCHNMSFIGLSYSFEMLYQAIRRCWRFGQTQPVNVYVYSTETEHAINASIWTKQAMHQAMKDSMAPLVREFQMEHLYGRKAKQKARCKTTEMKIPKWLEAHHDRAIADSGIQSGITVQQSTAGIRRG